MGRQGNRDTRRRMTKAEAKAKMAEILRRAPLIVGSPGFAAYRAANPVDAALWEALAKQTQKSGAAPAGSVDDGPLCEDRKPPEGRCSGLSIGPAAAFYLRRDADLTSRR